MIRTVVLFSFVLVTLSGCASSSQPSYPVSQDSVRPGSSVRLSGNDAKLYGGSFKVGDNLTPFVKDFELPLIGQVTVINIVPSIDTPVCEEQTHLLGESPKLDPRVKRVTISRDLPMAQARFAKEAKLTNITYASDYKDGAFGKKSGLLMKGPELLARAVIVTDQFGKVAYYQIVPDVGQLPDMEKAFDIANKLIK